MSKNDKEVKKSQDTFKLPRYLQLGKGAMWFDTDGEDSSGVRLFSSNKILVGRSPKEKDPKCIIPEDYFNNKNLIDFGWVENKDIQWYFDTKDIPSNKLSRIILAYKHGILIEADPKNPPKIETIDAGPEFGYKDGERVFQGKNIEMFKKTQTLPFAALKLFILGTPINQTGRNNLLDLLDYEQKGYNPMSRPRLEVLDAIKAKLKEFGPGISAIRVDEHKE